METPDMDPTRSADALATDIENYIEASRRMLAEGNMVELGELNVFVDALCQRVLNLAGEESQTFLPRLDALNGTLTTLQKEILDAQTRVRQELDANSKRQKASQAYRTPPDEKK